MRVGGKPRRSYKRGMGSKNDINPILSVVTQFQFLIF